MGTGPGPEVGLGLIYMRTSLFSFGQAKRISSEGDFTVAQLSRFELGQSMLAVVQVDCGS